MKKCYFCLICVFTLLASSCTQNYTMTEQSTAAGGAIGAGLGAIIGSQTGDAGAGLVIGALAGSGTGALIGNAIEKNNNQQQMASHDARISNNTRQIDSQKYEIQELRQRREDNSYRHNNSNYRENDGITLKHLYENSYHNRVNGTPDSYSHNTENTYVDTTNQRYTYNNHGNTNTRTNGESWLSKHNIWKNNGNRVTTTYSEPTYTESTVTESTYVEPTYVEPSNTFTESRIIIPDTHQETTIIDNTQAYVAPTKTTSSYTFNSDSSDCQSAEKEIANANASSDVADKLYHQRRALRLCPENPSYHNGLGEIYLSLNRDEDAMFEFEEALKIDPNYSSASRNLAILR